MNKFSLILFSLILSSSANAQFECSDIEVIGIFTNNLNVRNVSVLLTNHTKEPDTNLIFETDFQLKKGNDTLVYMKVFGFSYKLPMSIKDTVMYNLDLYNKYHSSEVYPRPNNSIRESAALLLNTDKPDCEIVHNVDSVIIDMPFSSNIGCEDFKVIGLYKTANTGKMEYSMLLTNTNKDSINAAVNGAYTSFEFFDEVGKSVSKESNSGYDLPLPKDTLVVHLEFTKSIDSIKNFTLRTKNPVCEINYERNLTSIKKVTEVINTISVYPNPTDGLIQINTGKTEEIIDVKLFNTQGQQVQFELDKNNLNISHLDAGMYVLQVFTKNGVFSEKVRKD
jgi:hypothetical protein